MKTSRIGFWGPTSLKTPRRFMVKEIGEEGVDAEEAATSTEEVRIA